jgi:hypothetical protein
LVVAQRFLTILTRRNMPTIRQSREAEPSIINEKTIADFMRVPEQTGLSQCGPSATEIRQPERSDDQMPALTRRSQQKRGRQLWHYRDGAKSGDDSHSLTCEAVSSWRTLRSNFSHSLS